MYRARKRSRTQDFDLSDKKVSYMAVETVKAVSDTIEGERADEVDLFCNKTLDNKHPSCADGMSADDPPFRTSNYERMLGKACWANPPWPLIPEALMLGIKLHGMDNNTRFTVLCPDNKSIRSSVWYHRYVRRGPYRIIKQFDPSEIYFYHTGSPYWDKTLDNRVKAGPCPFGLLMLRVP
jgi:hypothetical protein